jgi:hypothetical protein
MACYKDSFIWYISIWSRDNVIGIAIGYGLDDWGVGVRVPVGSKIFLSACRPGRFWVPLNLLSNGYRGLSPWFKAAGAWSWLLTPACTEFKSVWSIHPLPPLSHVVQIGSGVHPTSYRMGNVGSFPEVKRPGHEAGYSPPACTEFKKVWVYISIPPYAFIT